MEEWKDIEGFEGLYQVSSEGRVKSLGRYQKTSRGSGQRWNPERILSPYTRNGYLCIGLYRDAAVKTMKVHRLVAAAFLTQTPDRDQVNHINGQKTDNRLSNLEWCTNQENVDHAIETGLMNNKGTAHGGSKLTNEQVMGIRQAATSNGIKQSDIATMFGVSESQVSKIVLRKTWAHL